GLGRRRRAGLRDDRGMRVLVVPEGHGPAAHRLVPSAIALALRGHQVLWLGPLAPEAPVEGLQVIEGDRDLWPWTADVVVSDAGSPLRPALLGWQARALCQVIALKHARVARWGWIERWMWSSLHPQGLVDPEEAASFQERSLGLDFERLALWSDDPPAAAPDP